MDQINTHHLTINLPIHVSIYLHIFLSIYQAFCAICWLFLCAKLCVCVCVFVHLCLCISLCSGDTNKSAKSFKMAKFYFVYMSSTITRTFIKSLIPRLFITVSPFHLNIIHPARDWAITDTLISYMSSLLSLLGWAYNIYLYC